MDWNAFAFLNDFGEWLEYQIRSRAATFHFIPLHPLKRAEIFPRIANSYANLRPPGLTFRRERFFWKWRQREDKGGAMLFPYFPMKTKSQKQVRESTGKQRFFDWRGKYSYIHVLDSRQFLTPWIFRRMGNDSSRQNEEDVCVMQKEQDGMARFLRPQILLASLRLH